MLDQYVKVDFHIHSAASKTKKGDLGKTKDDTFDNIDVLFKRMNNSGVNVFSFTDHNTFDFDLYEKCKKKISEKNFKYKNIKCILPGIEFDLDLSNDEQIRIHATCIFNDSNPDKLKQIKSKVESVVDERSFNSIKFTEDELSRIIKDIGLDFILIVHQKSDIENDLSNGNNDFSKLSEDIKSRLIYCDFFTLYESNQLTYKFRFDQYKKEKRLAGNFITGTDCHVWKEYPDNSCIDKKFGFSFIKSDYTFNGLKVAITGDGNRRIVDAIPTKAPIVSEFKLKLNNENINIPLSSGINAIIGGNTSGKSLLIAKAFGEIDEKLNPQTFLDKWKLNIEKLELEEGIKIYKSQGEIRKLFEANGADLKKEFKDNFIKIDYSKYQEYINEAKDSLLEIAECNSTKSQLFKDIDCIINISNTENKNFFPIISPVPSKPSNPTRSLKLKFEKVKKELDEIKESIDKNDEPTMNKIINEFSSLANTYYDRNVKELLKISIYNEFKSALSDYTTTMEDKGMKTSEIELNQYYKIVDVYLENIESLIRKQLAPKINLMDSITEFEIEPISNPFDNLKYVTSPKVGKYTKTTVLDILNKPFKNSSGNISEANFDKIDIDFISQNLLINNKESIERLDYKQKYEVLLNEEIIKNYFCNTFKILMEDEPIRDTMSPGNNAVYYIKTITGKSHNKVIIFDQPEDDIAPEKIRTELIKTLTNLAITNQVIIVTHNPQLVVNLDVDNVICLDDDCNNKYTIFNGPLYEKESCNMLEIIANKLDGGRNALKERWKRYE